VGPISYNGRRDEEAIIFSRIFKLLMVFRYMRKYVHQWVDVFGFGLDSLLVYFVTERLELVNDFGFIIFDMLNSN
jgi:hypothetical protein